MALPWREHRPCDDAEKNGSALPPLAVSPLCAAPFLHMTIVCIDILEKILIESRKSHGQHPFRRT